MTMVTRRCRIIFVAELSETGLMSGMRAPNRLFFTLRIHYTYYHTLVSGTGTYYASQYYH